MMQNGRINSPSLDLACPQAEADNDKYVPMFRGRGVDKTKYGHRSIMYLIIIATSFNIKLYHRTFIINFS